MEPKFLESTSVHEYSMDELDELDELANRQGARGKKRILSVISTLITRPKYELHKRCRPPSSIMRTELFKRTIGSIVVDVIHFVSHNVGVTGNIQWTVVTLVIPIEMTF